MEKMGKVLKNMETPINLGRQAFNTCILPVMIYGMKTMALTNRLANQLRTSQRAIERTILEISLTDNIENDVIRRITKVEDVVARKNWTWAGHVARKGGWTKQVPLWRPRMQ